MVGLVHSVGQHAEEVALARAVEARHPACRLGLLVEVAQVGVEHAAQALAVLALGDELLQLVLEHRPLGVRARRVQRGDPVVGQGAARRVDGEDVLVQHAGSCSVS